MSTTASTGSPPERRPSGSKLFPVDENSKHPDEEARAHNVQASTTSHPSLSPVTCSNTSDELELQHEDLANTSRSQGKGMASTFSLKKSVSALSTSKLANQSNPKVRLPVRLPVYPSLCPLADQY
jgi:hypothetical protein